MMSLRLSFNVCNIAIFTFSCLGMFRLFVFVLGHAHLFGGGIMEPRNQTADSESDSEASNSRNIPFKPVVHGIAMPIEVLVTVRPQGSSYTGAAAAPGVGTVAAETSDLPPRSPRMPPPRSLRTPPPRTPLPSSSVIMSDSEPTPEQQLLQDLQQEVEESDLRLVLMSPL